MDYFAEGKRFDVLWLQPVDEVGIPCNSRIGFRIYHDSGLKYWCILSPYPHPSYTFKPQGKPGFRIPIFKANRLEESGYQ